MRNAFVQSLLSCAQEDSRVALLMAEVGFSVVEPFEKKFPNRFFNTGIAEQNLVTTAAGMAVAGMRPVAYSMSCFLPSRAFEQIKVSLCYQKLPVTLVSVGTGLSYGEMGPTHHAAEESAIMRSLPNMTVIFPSDATDMREALKWATRHDGGPVYISFPKAAAPSLPPHDFAPGKAVKYRSGSDGAILAVGLIADTALRVSDILNDKDIHLSVYGLHTVKPLDETAVTDAARTGNVFVLDEHYAGMGDAIASMILKQGIPVKRFADFSLPDAFPEKVMRYSEMLDAYGLTEQKIADRIAVMYKA
jgi:transketolase